MTLSSLSPSNLKQSAVITTSHHIPRCWGVLWWSHCSWSWYYRGAANASPDGSEYWDLERTMEPYMPEDVPYKKYRIQAPKWTNHLLPHLVWKQLMPLFPLRTNLWSSWFWWPGSLAKINLRTWDSSQIPKNWCREYPLTMFEYPHTFQNPHDKIWRILMEHPESPRRFGHRRVSSFGSCQIWPIPVSAWAV